MNVLHFSTRDHYGGAFIAARRLHRALRQLESVDSEFCVSWKSNGSTDITGLDSHLSSKIRRRLDRLPLVLSNRDKYTYHSLNWLPHPKAVRHVRKTDPDVVHLHWIQNGFIPMTALPQFHKPLVWTFHDMWPFAGMRHHEFEDPPRCLGAYDSTNKPSSMQGLDLDAWTWKRKRRIIESLDVTGIVPSQWMAEKARASSLWQEKRIEVIPNGIDSSIYQTRDRNKARDLFGLPQDRKVLLFGAMFADSDGNKGMKELIEALELLKAEGHDDLTLAIFGIDGCPEGMQMPFPAIYTGIVREEERMAALYNPADVVAVPSLQESFGLTACEAQACGTPVACFDTSGLRDIVEHEKTGYRAAAFKPEDLARGISWMLGSTQTRERLAAAAREKMQREFDLGVVAKRHADLYRELMEKE